MIEILCTNDDGIQSSGLAAAAKACKAYGNVRVYAPLHNKTCVGGTTTFGRQIKYEQVDYEQISGISGIEAFAIDGSPFDTMKFALQGHGLKPDLVVSGINYGVQIGFVPIFMSGTCAAAIRVAGEGIPSLALGFLPSSYEDALHDHHSGKLQDLTEYPGKILEELIGQALKTRLGGAIMWNINFPNKPTQSVQFVPMEVQEFWREWVEDFGGSFLNFGRMDGDSSKPGTDGYSIARGNIVITPCRLDMTDYKALHVLRAELGI